MSSQNNGLADQNGLPASNPYADPSEPALPETGFRLDLSKAALVVFDPQNDFLSPQGASWALFGASITENDTVANIGRLFAAAKNVDIPVAVSPHCYYPSDHEWHFGGPLEKVMHSICMFDRKGPVTLEGFEGSGADFLDEYKPFILDGKTIIASPHKVYGPETNDLALQLRKKGVSQIILAGMAVNLCIDRICESCLSKVSKSPWFAMRQLALVCPKAMAILRPSSTIASSRMRCGLRLRRSSNSRKRVNHRHSIRNRKRS